MPLLLMGMVQAMSADVGEAAAPPELLTQVPEDRLGGAGAGRLEHPSGVAGNPTDGHIYVADVGNARIDEFTAWGQFVKAWGWDVAPDGAEGDTAGDALEVCTSICQAGDQGAGPGQLAGPEGIVVDLDGNIHVYDEENHRVEKFGPEGEFLLMYGGDVNKTKVDEGKSEAERNICTAASGDECGIGVVGGGNGQFADGFPGVGSFVAVNASGVIYVGDEGRIEEFNADGTFKGQFALPEPFAAEGRLTRSLAVDQKTGDLYLTLVQNGAIETPEVPAVYKHTAAGWSTFVKEVGDGSASPPINGFPERLATDTAGNVYISARQKQTGQQSWQEILKFTVAGSCLICPGSRFPEPVSGESTAIIGIAVGGEACDVTDIYHTGGSVIQSFVSIFGPPPDPVKCPPPLRPPDITAQYATSVTSEEAVVRAAINPHFWPDTRYYVQFGTTECSKGGCKEQPLPPGSLLPAKANQAVNSSGVFLQGLEPHTTYRYRFVAQSSGGGPTYGIDPDGPAGPKEATAEAGLEATFTTPRTPVGLPPDGCPNAALRVGPSVKLPDCRAYEMVSPVDKHNADAVLLGETARVSQLNQSAEDGGAFTYSSYQAFDEPEAAPLISQYMSRRDPEDGWLNEALSAPRSERLIGVIYTGVSDYVGFLPDLCSGWLRFGFGPPLDPEAPAHYAEVYRRQTCGAGTYKTLNTTEPPNTDSHAFVPELQGFSADGSHAVFRANAKLTTNASSAELPGSVYEVIYQVYEAFEGNLRLISVLPSGKASDLSASAGTTIGNSLSHRHESVSHAVSGDGEVVYWTASEGFGPGSLYVRVNADQPQSKVTAGSCTEAARACTYRVSELVSGGKATFWVARPDGSAALFTLDGNLYRYDLQSKTTEELAGEVAGVLGANEDLSRVYLVSREAHDGGVAGEPNLYLSESGSLRFIATLADDDVPTGRQVRNPAAPDPSEHTARVSPDGTSAAFMSVGSLTGYDNTDVQSGEPDAEVYLYDAQASGGEGELLCVSCNPTNARPAGREVERAAGGLGSFWAAAQIPTWETDLYPERALSDNGRRLFFESFEGLVVGDANSRQDVYEWERAGEGGCSEDDITFSTSAGGCVRLISTGESSQDSEFLDATPSGSDVFFATAMSLVPQDPGLVDVYDARIGGGFPPPPVPPPACEGEACQSPPPAPGHPTPASSAYRGPGNKAGGKPKKHCGKGRQRVRRAGKTRCVKPKKHNGRAKRGGKGK